MNRLGRCILITFIESFATILVERGVYFFSCSKLHFSDAANLWLVLVFGMAYVLGALLGEAIFGFAAGLTYSAAIYYAMVVKNASVDAGGVHEGLIGAGFAIGPAMGLAGIAMAPIFGNEMLGVLAGVAVLMAVCAAGALRPLARGAGKRVI